MRVLLLSNSTAPGLGFLEHAREAITDVMNGGQRMVFFAQASFDPDGYTAGMQTALRPIDVEVIPAHKHESLVGALDQAEAIFVGGGNAFRLLKTFQEQGLIEAVRQRVSEGMPYFGASAGINIACPTIRTTNDMPIVQPRSFDALGLVPFQINPHYVDEDPGAGDAEVRDKRISEFLSENDVPVVGLREGAWLDVSGNSMVIGGPTGGRLFQRGIDSRTLSPGEDLSWLLETVTRYDSPQ